MLFNNDSLFVVGSVIFVLGGVIITYSLYNNIFPTINKSDSLINTNSSLNSISKLDSNIQLDNLPNHSYVEASVQTTNIQVEASIQAVNTHVNTGMQTSNRMWLETIRNWITEILSAPASNRSASVTNGNYVDVGVQADIQAETKTTWQMVKNWFKDTFSANSSELSGLEQAKVVKWRNNLDSIQSVDLHNSDSPLDSTSAISNSPLQKLVNPDDSASNITEVISDSSLHVPSNSVYDINVYNQEFLYNSLSDTSNYIDYNHVINGINHTVLVIGNHLLTVDPNIIINPFIC